MLMEDFQQALSFCELSDLGARGPRYTWHNGREGSSFIQERLDRAVATMGWSILFPDVEVLVEATLSLDHVPLIINLQEQSGRTRPNLYV